MKMSYEIWLGWLKVDSKVSKLDQALFDLIFRRFTWSDLLKLIQQYIRTRDLLFASTG